MTLILTQASPRYILQVSDRLLTRGRRRKPFDPVSNKTILYLARDALVSVAYSGNAYLDETPTDQWMAGVLIGKRLEPDDLGGLTIGLRGRRLDIGQSIELLRTELGSAISRLPRSEEPPSLHVVIAGWQWNRKRARPIMTHMVTSTASPSFLYVRPLPRYWHFQRTPEDRSLEPTCFSPAPTSNPLSHEEQVKVSERLSQTISVDDSTQILIDAIRLAASKRPQLVSEACMCIYLPHPSWRSAQIVFTTPHEQRVAITGKVEEELPVTFSPWVVGSGLVWAPSIVMGAHTINTGPFTVKLRGLTRSDDSGTIAGWGTQPRPPDPQRRRSHS
jgi:hypothetical protein